MLRLLTSSAAVALLAGAAFAADLPVYEPPVEPMAAPVAYNWTGFYAGISGGYAWGDYTYDFGPPDVGSDLEGWLVGGQVGYDWQNGAFVLGAVADISWADINGTSSCPNPAFSCDASVEWFGTVRGRVGVAFDRILVYGTGGFAYGGMQRDSSNGVVSLTQNETHIGWTAGGGVGFGVTNNLTLGAEALWVDLENETYNAVPPSFSQVEIGSQFVVVRGTASFKF